MSQGNQSAKDGLMRPVKRGSNRNAVGAPRHEMFWRVDRALISISPGGEAAKTSYFSLARGEVCGNKWSLGSIGSNGGSYLQSGHFRGRCPGPWLEPTRGGAIGSKIASD